MTIMTQASKNTLTNEHCRPSISSGKQRGPLHTEAYEYDGKSIKVPPAGEYLRAPVCCAECEAFWKALILEVNEKHTSKVPAGKASLILARGARGSVLQIKSVKHHVTKESRFLGCKNVTVRVDAIPGSCQSATTQISSNPTSIKSGDHKSRTCLSRQGSLYNAYGAAPNVLYNAYDIRRLHEVCACSFCSSPRHHSHGHGVTDKPKSAIYPKPPKDSRSHRLFNTSAHHHPEAISVGHGFKPIRTHADQRPEEGFNHLSTPRRYTPISHGLPSSSQLRPLPPPTTEKASSREVSTTPRMYSSAKHGGDFLRYSYAQTPSSRGRSDTHNYGASPKHKPEDYLNSGHQNANPNPGQDFNSPPWTPQTSSSRGRWNTSNYMNNAAGGKASPSYGIDRASPKQQNSGHQNANPNPGQDFLQKNSPPWTPQTSSARGRWNTYNDMNNAKASPTSNSYGIDRATQDYQNANPNPGRGDIPPERRLSRTSTMESGYTSLSIPRSDSSANSQDSPSSCKTLDLPPNAESLKVPHCNNLSRTSTGTSSSSLMEPILLFTGHGCRSETDEDDDTNPNYFKHIITNPNYIKHIVKPIPPPPPPPGLKTS